MKKFIFATLILLVLGNIAFPTYAASAAGTPDIKSETAVLMDADTGQVLYRKEMDKRMYPASITKIMTGLLALREGNLSDLITISENAVKTVDSDSAHIALSPGEQLTLEQALYAISVASANDAANGIADWIGGSSEAFISMMNAAAEEAGAINTHFNNANGLPDEDHYTTAHDMALMTARALQTPGFTEIFGEKRYKIPPTNMQPETRILNSSNRLLNGDMIYDGMLISKAGWTNDAQHTLVSAAERDGTTLIVVVMKSSDSMVKWTDTVSLLDYGFSRFKRVTIAEEDILRAAPDDLELPDGNNSKPDPDTYDVPDVSLLLPIDTPPEEIVITYGTPRLVISTGQAEIPVRFSVVSDDPLSEPDILSEATVMASVQPVIQDTGSEKQEPAPRKTGVFMLILIIAASLIGVLILLLVFLFIRRAVIVRRRRQRKIQAGRHGRR